MSAKGTSNILRDFTVVKEPKPFQLSEITFYEYEAHYVFEHADLTHPLKVELISLKALHNGFYYDFNFHQSSAQNQTAELEYKRFKESIRLI